MGYVSLLLDLKRGVAEMQRLGVESGPAKEHVSTGSKRNTRHCMPRLLNVMFLDRFIHRLRDIDGRPSRQELDTTRHTRIRQFGLTPTKSSTPITWNTAHLSLNVIIVPHDSAKLRDMWKDITSRCNTALANSRVSSNHDNDFISFCSGKIDVLYMHERLRTKPDLAVTVECKLPRMARINTINAYRSEEDSDTEVQPPKKKQRCRRNKKDSSSEAMIDKIFSKMDQSDANTMWFDMDCRLAQLVPPLSTLLAFVSV
ncbi:hypothetical protein GQ600_3163 [Phytophthora cactorum]|nr:hypothetical protein GQ600_3163 [Phytophthora cactorum]